MNEDEFPPLVRYVVGGYPLMMPQAEAEYYAIATGYGEIVPFTAEEIAEAERNSEELMRLFDDMDTRIGTSGTELTAEHFRNLKRHLEGG